MPTATANDVLEYEVLHACSEFDRFRLEDCKSVRGPVRGGVHHHAIATSKERHLALLVTPPLGPRGPVGRRGPTVTVCRFAAPTATVAGRRRAHRHLMSIFRLLRRRTRDLPISSRDDVH
eukprot:scaffold60290_cov36-Phaeocystis_antarctica.AAC.1